MKCPLCNLEMRIKGARLKIENDDTADLETKLYREIDLICVNEKCPNNGKVVETVKTELDLTKG